MTGGPRGLGQCGGAGGLVQAPCLGRGQEAAPLVMEIPWGAGVWQPHREPREAQTGEANREARVEKTLEGCSVGVRCKIKSGKGWGSALRDLLSVVAVCFGREVTLTGRGDGGAAFAP